jgi:hypothetical protein
VDIGSTLGTIAQVAAAFIGFTGVIFAVGRFSTGVWNTAEHNALKNLLMPSLMALFLAFVPMVLGAGLEEATLWRLSNVLLVIVHAPLVTQALWRALRSELAEPVLVRFILIPGGYLSIAASALVACGVSPKWAPSAFAGGLVWFLFVAAIQFVMLILPDRVGTIAEPETHWESR